MNVSNHDKVPFREMTAEERIAIVEEWMLRNVEYWSGESWCKNGTDAIFSYVVYRTKPRQLIIPWDVIKPEYKWAAMDKNGEVNVHSKNPKECEDGWWSTSEARLFALNIDTTGIDWRESLVQRPEGV